MGGKGFCPLHEKERWGFSLKELVRIGENFGARVAIGCARQGLVTSLFLPHERGGVHASFGAFLEEEQVGVTSTPSPGQNWVVHALALLDEKKNPLLRKEMEGVEQGGGGNILDLTLPHRLKGGKRQLEKRLPHCLRPFFPHCHLLVGEEEDFLLCTGESSLSKALAVLSDCTPATLVLKREGVGCDVLASDLEEPAIGMALEAEVRDETGAEEAFLSGFLKGWIQGEDLDVCATWASACRGLAASRDGGTLVMPYALELEAMMESMSINPEVVDEIHLSLNPKLG